jgi:hypothetical protein
MQDISTDLTAWPVISLADDGSFTSNDATNSTIIEEDVSSYKRS